MMPDNPQTRQGLNQRYKVLVQDHSLLLVVLLTFIALGLLYNVSLPLFEAPDEMHHFLYANWLATEHNLPNMRTDLQIVGHEVGQPPLYYAILAPFIAGIDTHDLEHIAPINPYWRKGAGTNVHYHTPAERFPYRNTSLAVHLARFISTLIASITIISAYGLTRIVLPNQAVLAAALVAFNPQFVFMSASINNDNLVAALSGLTMLLLVHNLVSPRISWRPYALVGALWGLSTLAKLSGLALGGVILIGLLLAACWRKSWKPFILGIPGIVGGITLTAGWWFVRNWMLYSNPLAWNEFLAANKGLLRSDLLGWLKTLHYATFLHRSFWAMFGYGISAPSSFYWVVNFLGLLGLVGLILWLVRTGRHRPIQSATLAVSLLIAWNLIVFLSLLRWMRQVNVSNQGRLFFPAISSLAVLLTLGFATLSGRRNWLGLTMVVFLVVWATVSPFLIIQPAYEQPELLSIETNVPNPVFVLFGEDMRLLGYQLPQPVVRAGESLIVELYWQALMPISESNVVALHVVDADGKVVAGLDTIPYKGRYSTAVWQVGQSFRDIYSLPIQPDLTPGQGSLWLAVYPWGCTDCALSVSVNGSQVGQSLNLTRLKLASNKILEFSPANISDVIFGQQAKLMGFDVPEEVQDGQSFSATLYWEALAPDGNDYTVFVHLLDDSGRLITQADSPPQDNHYPTSIWAPGEKIQDPHRLSLPNGLAGSRCQLAIGLYDPNTGQRLSAIRADGTRWLDDRVLLGSVEVTD
ncbi:MAG: glycosyltransferase family 39 protein [Anaerolineales bacterium]|nr:glycosyltransferase family 39 protein [Anaerolineales bacterium]